MLQQIHYNPLPREAFLKIEGKTEEDYQTAVKNGQESVLNTIRNERNRLLTLCDWTQFNDSPLSEEKKQEWLTYRQQLRDFPGTINFDVPFVIDEQSFPQKPE